MALILMINLLVTSMAGYRPASVLIAAFQDPIDHKYDKAKDITTISLPSLKISDERDNYYSLHVTTSFDYPGQTSKMPAFFRFEIRSVVKGRKLNSDLYIVFLIDGEEIHLSSNRWAERNPLPGRRAIAEVIVMKMPAEMFLKLISAKQSAIKMGRTEFVLTANHKETLRRLADLAKL